MLALTSTSIFGIVYDARPRTDVDHFSVTSHESTRAVPEQLGQRARDVAVVAHGAARAGAALQVQARSQPRGRREVDAMPVGRARVAVVPFAGHVVLRAAGVGRRRDGHELRHLARRPAGSRAAESEANTSRSPPPSSATLSVTKKLPHHRRLYAASTDSRGISSCCTDAPNCQS